MSLTYGFYNSYNHDRVYDAEQFSSFFDGIIDDGVFEAYGKQFHVDPTDPASMKVTVDSGRAWLDHTWTLNTSKYSLTVSTADTVYSRIDAVVIEVNKTDRKNYLKIIKGTPAASPVRPTLASTSTKIQHVLAYINVAKNATSITATNITNMVDKTGGTQFVSALNLSGIPGSGEIGEVLVKLSSVSGDVGWRSINNLPFNKWYLANGLSESNVIAAFKFISQPDQTTALTTKNTSRTVTLTANGITWQSGSGVTISGTGCMHSSDIYNASDLCSVIAKYSDASSSKVSLIATLGSNKNRNLFIRTPYTSLVEGKAHGIAGSGVYYNAISYDPNGTADQPVRASSTSYTSGVIGCTFKSSGIPDLYLNGSSVNISTKLTQITGGVASTYLNNKSNLIGNAPKGNTSNNFAPEAWGDWGSYKLQFIAFYNTELTAAQHLAICNQMNNEQ